jgi:hypothetical protein
VAKAMVHPDNMPQVLQEYPRVQLFLKILAIDENVIAVSGMSGTPVIVVYDYQQVWIQGCHATRLI